MYGDQLCMWILGLKGLMNLYFSFICLFVKDDAQEEFGWKLVHGDVFRPPKKGMLLSIMLGCGSQIFIMVFFTLGRLAILSVMREQGMLQWWEHSPPTSVVRVQIPASMPYVG